MTMFDLLATTPALFIAIVFVASLLVGSFLNVVIHRLPIMLDREWRAQARETLETDGRIRGSRGPLQPGRAALCLPAVRRVDQGAPEHPRPQLPAARRTVRKLPCARSPRAIPIVELATGAPVRGRRVALRMALADARCAAPHLGADRAHRDRLRPPDPARRRSRCRCSGSACCSRSPGTRDCRPTIPVAPGLGDRRRGRRLPRALARLLGLQAGHRARKAWATATSSCSPPSAPGWAGRCCR